MISLTAFVKKYAGQKYIVKNSRVTYHHMLSSYAVKVIHGIKMMCFSLKKMTYIRMNTYEK